ncbi:MAG: hypothetical protein RR228_00450 [Bacilli bacterium]
MGLFNKLKNIFYDVEEVEDSSKSNVKTETIKVEEIPAFKKEEHKVKDEVPKREEYSERELFQSKSTFNFPIFEDEEPVKTRTRSVVEEKKEINTYKAPEVTVKKEFKLSPVISPVYGILDKNYKKDEVVEKKENITVNIEHTSSYDIVRRKAYGSLEEELENTLTKMNDNLSQSVNDVNNEISNLNNAKEKNSVNDILDRKSTYSNISIGQAEESYKENNFDETISDNTLEHDLFNLIDSMYDKEE